MPCLSQETLNALGLPFTKYLIAQGAPETSTKSNVVIKPCCKRITGGEAPGANEDEQGEPFVGRAGLLLNEMLKSIGLSRDAIFIANILKCRPPNNRDPKTEEVNQCLNHLLQQIALLQPKLILTVGRISTQTLLNKKEALSRLRGNTYHYHDIPVIATYHPAYLLRSPREKNKAYKDLLRAQAFLQNEITAQ